IERGIATRDGLQPVVKIQDDFVKRKLVSEQHALWGDVFEAFLHAPLLFQQLQDAAQIFILGEDLRPDNGFFNLLNVTRRRKLGGRVHFQNLTRLSGDAVADAWGSGDQVEIEFALQALLDDFHVQQPEETAAEAEAQSLGVLRLVEKRGVIQPQLLERVAQEFVTAGGHGIKPRKDHGLDFLEAGKRRGGGSRVVSDGITDACVRNALDIGDDEPDFSRLEAFHADGLRRQHTQFLNRVDLVVGPKANPHTHRQGALEDAAEHHHAAITVEPGIKDQRPERFFRGAARRRDARHDGLQHLIHAEALFGADQQRLARIERQSVFDLLFGGLNVRARKVDLVDDGNDRQIVVQGKLGIGKSLRLDSLGGIDHQDCALARGKAPRNLVGEVDMAGSIDQVQLVQVPIASAVVKADGVGLDRD